jgi:transketolase
MGLEDLAMLRAVHGSTVLCRCDANQTVQLVEQMADLRGIRYLRTTRPSTPVIHGPDERFEIGDSHVVRASEGDQMTLVGAGITVHGAIEAAHAGGRGRRGLGRRLLPRQADRRRGAAGRGAGHRPDRRHRGPLARVRPGGMRCWESSPTVTSPPESSSSAVGEMRSSGKPEELLASAGIDATGIAEAARRLVGG